MEKIRLTLKQQKDKLKDWSMALPEKPTRGYNLTNQEINQNKEAINKEYLGKANVEHLLFVNTELSSSNFANYVEGKDYRYLVVQGQGM